MKELGIKIKELQKEYMRKNGNVVDKICINQLIENLEDREKQLILLRYYKGQTQSEVAKVLGITQVQVSRIEKKVLNSMRLKLVI